MYLPGTSIIQQQSTGIPRGIDIHQLPDYAVLYMERMLSFHLNDSKLQVEPCGHKITTQAATLYHTKYILKYHRHTPGLW